MDSEFRAIMGWLGKMYGEYQLIHGDFLDHKEVFHSSKIIFTNNYAFSPELNLKLKTIFADLTDGVRILVSKSLTDEKFRINEKTCNDPSAVLPVRDSVKGKVSWTDGDVTFFVHIVDRTSLDKFLKSRDDPCLRAQFEDEQRMGRPNYYESSSEQDSRDIHERSDGELTEEEQRPRRGCTTRSQWNRTNNKRKIVRDSSTESESDEDVSLSSIDFFYFFSLHNRLRTLCRMKRNLQRDLEKEASGPGLYRHKIERSAGEDVHRSSLLGNYLHPRAILL